MSRRGLYTASGHFMEFTDQPNRTDLTYEIATRETAGAGLLGTLGSFLSILPDPDPILLKRGDGVEILHELMADDQVTIATEKRRLRTQNKQTYQLTPGVLSSESGPTHDAQRVCEALLCDLENIDLLRLFGEILDTPYYGMSVIELLWEHTQDRYRLVDALAKPLEWFAFDSKNRLGFRGVGNAQLTLLPEHKYVLVRNGSSFANPYGRRLLSRCLWPVAFKKGGVEFYVNFLEKYGQPWLLAKAPPGQKGSNSIHQMAQDLAAMVQDAVAVLPHGAEVHAESVGSKGGGEMHLAFLRYWDGTISKILSGQTLATDQQGEGARAAAETHAAELDELAKADETMLVDAMNTLAWSYSAINAPAGTLSPVFEYVEPEDLEAKARLAKGLTELGVQFRRVYFSRHFGLADDEYDVPSESAGGVPTDSEESSAPPNPADPADHAERGDTSAVEAHQSVVDAMLHEIQADAEAADKEQTETLRAIIEQAETPEELYNLLAERLGDLGRQRQEDLLARVIFAADAYGHWSAETEAKEGA